MIASPRRKRVQSWLISKCGMLGFDNGNGHRHAENSMLSSPLLTFGIGLRIGMLTFLNLSSYTALSL